jgi:hypothetical protein
MALVHAENHEWLDKIIAEQSEIYASSFGDSNIVQQAAEAYDHFSEDDLEDAMSLCH